MKIAICNPELGEAGGIDRYSFKLCKHLNKSSDVDAEMFIEKPPEHFDILSVQYEPACCNHKLIESFLKDYTNPIVMTVHHNKKLKPLYNVINGFVYHSKSQIKEEPYNFTIIPHPALVYPKKDKVSLRRKIGLPLDKKIVGTSGFIFGAGKNLPKTVRHILKRLNDDEFLYLSTAKWKHGDGGKKADILTEVKRLGKEDQFKIDTDFVDEETLNERMQACDLLYTWTNPGPNYSGCQSGIAADMYGSRTKLVVQDIPRYDFISRQDKVKVGRKGAEDFADDVISFLRDSDLNDVQDPEWLSWKNQTTKYYEYFKKIKEIFG